MSDGETVTLAAELSGEERKQERGSNCSRCRVSTVYLMWMLVAILIKSVEPRAEGYKIWVVRIFFFKYSFPKVIYFISEQFIKNKQNANKIFCVGFLFVYSDLPKQQENRNPKED